MVVQETVTLVGGPCDGDAVTITGGDTVEFVFKTELSSVSLLREGGAAPALYGDRALYRRSLKTGRLFVFQP